MRTRGHILTLPDIRPGPALASAAAWLSDFRCLGGLAALAVAYLALAARSRPPTTSCTTGAGREHLQLSYYDHPPMTAYMIRAATEVFGDTLFAIRLPAVLSTLTVLGVIGWLTRPRHLLPRVVFTPLFTFGAVLVTPDTPLLLFWSAVPGCGWWSYIAGWTRGGRPAAGCGPLGGGAPRVRHAREVHHRAGRHRPGS